jgi:hypothetical protein
MCPSGISTARRDLVTLTRNVHFSVTIGAGGAVSIAPIALPPAPGTLADHAPHAGNRVGAIQRSGGFPGLRASVARDAAALRDQELWDYVGRFVVPFTNLGGVLDFSPYRLRAADPIATRIWRRAAMCCRSPASTVAANLCQSGAASVGRGR